MMNKTLHFFKLSTLALLAMGMFTFGTCEKDDDNDGSLTQKEYAEQYFSIKNATYHDTAMPTSTTSQIISGVSISSNDNTVTITIVTDVEYDRFYVGVGGKRGYLEYTPAGTRIGSLTYNIPLSMGTSCPEKVDLIMKALTKNGDVTAQYSQTVEPFGSDIGRNNVDKIKGVWRYEYEQADDMGTVYMDYRFLGSTTSKVADYNVEEYEKEGAWHSWTEGQYKLMGSTLHLYARRGRDDYMAGHKNWRDIWPTTMYNTWEDYLNSDGVEVYECIVNDAKTEMQWRVLKTHDYNAATGTWSYVYDDRYPIRHLKKM